MLPASSNLPEDFGRAGLTRPPIWSCSERGLPSLPRRRGNWWALTPPFHPYPALILPRKIVSRRHASRQSECRAVCFLWRFPGIAPTGRYPASRPVEPGLSSRHSPCREARFQKHACLQSECRATACSTPANISIGINAPKVKNHGFVDGNQDDTLSSSSSAK